MFSSYLNAQHIFDNLTPGLPESFRILTLFDKKFQSLWKPQVLGQYVFASEYFDLHITSFWNNTFFRRICDLKNTRQWFQTKRKESIFQDCCKTIISVIGLLPQSPSNVPAVFLRLCHGTEQMKTQVHISWVGQSTTPSPLQKIGSQGSAANNQTIKCRKLWKIRWATNNVHPLK